MTALDLVRAPAAGLDPGAPATEQPAPTHRPLLSGRQFSILLLILTVLLTGTLALVFGPGRGLRTDIGYVNDDLDASRVGIFQQLDTVRAQLGVAERSLVLQDQGLAVAVDTQQIVQTTSEDTEAVRQQTQEVLASVREVTAALGPLEQLEGEIDTVVAGVQAGVTLAESTLRIAEQTLATGRETLAVAKDTLATLQRSEQVQRQLLEVARRTLEQTEEINRKMPGAPIFPSGEEPAPPTASPDR